MTWPLDSTVSPHGKEVKRERNGAIVGRMDRAFSPYEHWECFPGPMAQAGMMSRRWRCVSGTFLRVFDGINSLSGEGHPFHSSSFLRHLRGETGVGSVELAPPYDRRLQ